MTKDMVYIDFEIYNNQVFFAGPTMENLVPNPLAVSSLDNQLCMYNINTHFDSL